MVEALFGGMPNTQGTGGLGNLGGYFQPPSVAETFAGSPQALWQAARIGAMTPQQAFLPQFQRAAMVGYEPEFGRYLLGGNTDPFSSYLEARGQMGPQTDATRAARAASTAANWESALAASQALRSPTQAYTETGNLEGGVPAPSGLSYAQLAMQGMMTGEDARRNTLAMAAAGMGGGTGYGAQARQSAIGNLYDLYAARAAGAGASPGGFLSWFGQRYGPQPVAGTAATAAQPVAGTETASAGTVPTTQGYQRATPIVDVDQKYFPETQGATPNINTTPTIELDPSGKHVVVNNTSVPSSVATPIVNRTPTPFNIQPGAGAGYQQAIDQKYFPPTQVAASNGANQFIDFGPSNITTADTFRGGGGKPPFAGSFSSEVQDTMYRPSEVIPSYTPTPGSQIPIGSPLPNPTIQSAIDPGFFRQPPTPTPPPFVPPQAGFDPGYFPPPPPPINPNRPTTGDFAPVDWSDPMNILRMQHGGGFY